MTLDEILKLRAEKPDEFCVLVAEKVMGCEWRGNRTESRLYSKESDLMAVRDRSGLRLIGYMVKPVLRFIERADGDLEAHRAACAWETPRKRLYFQTLGSVLQWRGTGQAHQPSREEASCNVRIALLEWYQTGDYAAAALASVLATPLG